VEGVTRLDDLAVGDQDPRPPRELVRNRLYGLALLVDLVREDRELRPPVGVLEAHAPADLDQLGRALGVPRLEDLDDAGKAVRDVRACNAARVEGPHRQLRAWLADRLRGDDPDRVADLAHLAGGEEDAVAGLTHAELAAALEHGAHRDRRRK